jgi:sulfite reductase subunit B
MEAKIVRAHKVTELEKHFTLKMADGSKMQFDPGQILEVSLFGFGEIPIGFASSPTRENTFDIVIRTVGRVSTAVNNLNEGDSLFIRGPLGNGFDVSKFRDQNVLIVAGGLGLCPTRSMINYIMDRKDEFKKFTLFYGTKDRASQLFLDDLKTFRESDKVDYHETVDNGDSEWKGNVGVITTLFKNTEITPDTRVIICGPPVMFKFVLKELEALNIPRENVYVDLERRMKCGVGKCGHCQINDKYACVDGPVFSIAELENLEEAL